MGDAKRWGNLQRSVAYYGLKKASGYSTPGETEEMTLVGSAFSAH